MAWVRLREVRGGTDPHEGMLFFCFVLSVSVGVALFLMVSWHVYLISTGQVGAEMLTFSLTILTARLTLSLA